MTGRKRRIHLFIHASTQGKVIALSILPALLMAVYCLYVVYVAAWPVAMASVNAPRASVLEARTLIATYESPEYATAISRSALLRRLDAQLADLDAELTAGRESMAAAWSAARTRVALAGLAALLLVGALAVSTSHRFVGPLARIRSDLESLAAGERIAPVKLRKHDEFGELAAAVEALRQRLEAESGGS